jgi:hypothetical protein
MAAMDFDSDEELVEAIAAIDRDDDLFRRYQRAACFTNNEPTPYWDMKRLNNFYRRVFELSPV